MKTNILGGLVCLTLALSGCASSTDLRTAPPSDTFRVDRNYQQVYRDMLAAARACNGVGRAGIANPVFNNLDAELYSDLGYGEIYYWQDNAIDIPFFYVRVNREGSSSVVQSTVGRPMGIAQDTSRFRRWASGDTRCVAR